MSAVGAIYSPIQAVASVERISTRPGDTVVHHRSTTSGTLARQWNVDDFMESDCELLFMLDDDMIYPADCLERLRNHNVPMVSGLYIRRDVSSLLPAAWYEPREPSEFPMVPLTDFPDDAVIPVGAVGHGFCLIHREVFNTLRGRYTPDMLRAPMPAWTGQPNLHVGPDVRFFQLARQVGYKVLLDTGCRAEHFTVGTLTVEDYQRGPWRHNHKWFGKTALARMLRRAQMGQDGVTKEDLAMYAEQTLRDLKNLEGRKAEILKRIEAEAERYESELQQIQNSIHAKQGALIACREMAQAVSGKARIIADGRADA